MKLYRVFPWDPDAAEDEIGGVFYSPRQKQGAGRHDVPHLDGVLYSSLTAQSALAEFIQFYRGRKISKIHLRRPDKLITSMAHFEYRNSARLVDLDDPDVLVRFHLKPSQVMTHDRSVTRNMAETLYASGAKGLLWPSALEASWINATLFTTRCRGSLSLIGKIAPVTLVMPEMGAAASFLNVTIDDK